jgi:uncharacterized protein YgiM (DUF1202 family)
MATIRHPRRAVVVRDYARQYADPIQVRAGTVVRVEREDNDYPGWWWCTAPDGRAGWVPGELLRRRGDVAEVAEEYSACELNVRTGEAISVECLRAEWARVRNAQGSVGWVPFNCIRLE